MNPPPSSPPRLAPPGAGLPKIELLVANLLFHVRRLRASRSWATALFTTQTALVRALAERCDPEAGRQPVLIPRLRGMEDSSRYWSVFMTVEHVRIVNAGVARTMSQLLQGKVPDWTISTATVKPRPGADSSVVPAFVQGCADLARIADSAADLHTRVRFAHPWFGQLDAAGWHLLAGIHLRLHRQQIELILAGLPATAARPSVAAT